ncbi:MAG: flagellar motor switch protein FliG [Bacillota bacterium]|nr:flagellar motor switch protein FliG [Bacillota bacterium]
MSLQIRPARRQNLNGRQKAAALLIALGSDTSATVFRHLQQDEIEQLTLEIAATRSVDVETRNKVLEEFHQMCVAQEYLSQGGLEYARQVLYEALGPERTKTILNQLTSTLQVRPFDFLRRTDAAQLLSFIRNEHPQTIALILAYLEPSQSAVVLASLPQDLQTEVTRRIAVMDRTSPDVVREVERVLERKVASVASEDYTAAGGLDTCVAMLNRVDRGTEKQIIEALLEQDPELAEEIRKRMFVFEDLINIDDRYMQRVLRDVDLNKDLPLALKVASEEVTAKIQRNLSKRAVENLVEAIEYLGPVRLRQVEEAQQKIVNLVRRLEEEGEIVTARGSGGELIV